MPRRGRTWLLVAAVFAALVVPTVARADPGEVYQDFVLNGGLSCTHTQGDLKAVIANAGLNQYSDQATMTDLRIAVQRALANGCYVGAKRVTPAGAHDGGLLSSVAVFVGVSAAALLLLGVAGVAIRRALDEAR
jgi:hypothetical protein